MKPTPQSKIGDIVAADYRTASLFDVYEFDFCCNGERTLAEICEEKKMDTSWLIEEITKVMQQEFNQANDYQSWRIDLLADYIEKKHHAYVESKLNEIPPYLNKIVRVHGDHHPELVLIENLFLKAAGELAAHMKKEELILFPYIRKMIESKKNRLPLQAMHFGTVENPVNMMKHEHNVEGDHFRKISALSNHYTPPADACNTYKVTYALLNEFENDLHLHIHLENNILFPKAIALEDELKAENP